jgi:hypothetical protein
MVNGCSSIFSSLSLPGVFPFDEFSFQPLAARQAHHSLAGLLAVREIARVHPAVGVDEGAFPGARAADEIALVPAAAG